MYFEIDFDDILYSNDNLLEKIGAKLFPTGSKKYPPFEIYKIDIIKFEHLEGILQTIDEELDVISDVVISFDPPTIHIRW